MQGLHDSVAFILLKSQFFKLISYCSKLNNQSLRKSCAIYDIMSLILLLHERQMSQVLSKFDTLLDCAPVQKVKLLNKHGNLMSLKPNTIFQPLDSFDISQKKVRLRTGGIVMYIRNISWASRKPVNDIQSNYIF